MQVQSIFPNAYRAIGRLRGYGFLVLSYPAKGVIGAMDSMSWVAAISVIIAEKVFLYVARRIDNEKISRNGVSILILAGIVAGLPTAYKTNGLYL